MTPRTALAAALLAATSLIGIGCVNIGSDTYSALEPQDLPEVVSYQQDIAPIVSNRCGACHSSSSGRAAEGARYDDYFDVVGHWSSFKNVAITAKTMPPGGKERVSPREEAILLKWEEQHFGH